ncbi:biofilm/acid-resistance regulator YmgB/AriR [Erwinia aphidicola]|uniref:biofilm/acid-resistance regulator YmgB/AriR n=1 Tax=Erwinia aphidicola TaxID=68334 RepID=UPI003017405D
MQQQSTESEIVAWFQGGEEKYAQESQALGGVIRDLIATGQLVNNKAIILKLIEKLETTSDVVELDVYRQVLEVVVGLTPDDA